MATDAALGKAIVFPVVQAKAIAGLRISSVGAFRKMKSTSHPRLNIRERGDGMEWERY